MLFLLNQMDLENLLVFLDNDKSNEVKKILDKILKLYKSNAEIVDHIFTEQISFENLKKDSTLDKNQIKVVSIES